MVHGAIFNRRTQILMDTGAVMRIMSLYFARKLKLKLRRGYRLRVSGFGDVPKYATAKAKIKLTLGVGVIYVMDIWVGNIGADLDCLIGMDFMIAAGVRLCARKGVVRLPDEESLFLVGGTELDHVELEIDVSLAETVRLQPGRSVILPVMNHQAEPDKTVEWAGRGDQWVTQFIYGPGRKPKAVKVVNISDEVARITQHTVVACLAENEHFPQGKCFVRPRSRNYREWSALAYAAEPSTEYLKLEELVARQAELRGPPAVERPTYTWPKKLLLAKRPSKKDDVQSAGPEPKVSVYMVNTNPPAQPKSMLSQGRHTSIWPPLHSGDPLFMSTQPKLTTVTEVDEDSQSETDVADSIPTSDDSELKVVPRMMTGGGTMAQGAQRELKSVFKVEPLDFVADTVHRLRESFTRCMRLESNFPDAAAAAVYFHEGTELLNDLGGRLVALPELNDLGPKANLTTADLGKPGVVIPEMEAQVRTVLEKHHSNFQGERHVVPGPVRAKRPPRKDGGELGGADPRASAYRMNAHPQGQSEGVPRRIGQDDATQTWRSTYRTSVAPEDVSSELTRSDRAEGEAGIAKAETENDPASDESEPEVVSRVMIDGCTTTHGAQKELAKVFKAQPVDFAAKPVSRLKESLGRCMRLEMEPSDEAEATVYFYEGTELLKGLRNELAVLLKQKDLSPKADLTTADIGETGVTTKAMEAQARAILVKHHDNFLEDGNAVPAPARRVVGDINVDDAKPVAWRFRSVRPEHLRKTYDQLEKLFQTELIEYSHSEWASPIVIRMKKNGGDIRTCIDYRIAIQLVKLTHCPLPLIDDLLIGFESVLWVLSSAMAKRLRAVPMTLWVKHISVLICLLRHFQWTKMLLGLKNAPPICQQMLVNCLWSFVRLPASETAQMDVDGLAFLGIDVGDSAETDLSTRIEGMTVFGRNVPSSPQLNSVRGERPYICDIGYGAETWEQLCVDLDRRLYRLRYWGTSVSLLKNKFGKKWFPHEIEADRIRAQSKIAEGVTDLPSPSPLRDVQPFLASLNYYDEFIERLPVIAAVLNKLTDEQIRSSRDLGRGMEAFGILKRKIVSTPLLRGPDSQKAFVIIIHANPWATCAVLGQESDGVLFILLGGCCMTRSSGISRLKMKWWR
ncbi:hypothetical protein PR003_g25122 [Phytophthora rubi]|uniref:Peptidase A2 domain-containing protein n=1 Tax=Phytophthora rubi TaxID=129364 RepID=A0A6A4CH80_9STRA|nr:hypothetical protein PR003_g25122 [Phytophthora rubi]